MINQKRKILQPCEKIVQSLLALREELYDRAESGDSELEEARLKINSCLYAEYPHVDYKVKCIEQNEEIEELKALLKRSLFLPEWHKDYRMTMLEIMKALGMRDKNAGT